MAPPLPPTPVGVPAYPALTTPIKVSVEVYLDLDCPFSKKMFKVLYEAIFHAFEGKGVQFIFHNVIQPWHPTSTLMHEVSLAVKAVAPSSFFAFVNAVYADMERFSDEQTWNKTRPQVYEELGDLAALVGVSKEEVLAKVALKGGGNAGNQVTQDVKYCTRYHRVRSVHVTPTVFVNGLEAVEVSSGWSADDWKQLLDRVLAA